MKTQQRIKHTPESIADALKSLGLKEEEKPLSGYAYTHWKEPAAAVRFWSELNGGRVPTRFYIDRRSFILSA